MSKKSQIFKNKLDLQYIIDFFVENFCQNRDICGSDISNIILEYDAISPNRVSICQSCKYICDSSVVHTCEMDNPKVIAEFHLNKVIYRKMKYHGKVQPFFDYISDYYYVSKKKYVEKEPTYKSFVTVIRQICKFFGFNIMSDLKYIKSTYEINYNIYITNNIK